VNGESMDRAVRKSEIQPPAERTHQAPDHALPAPGPTKGAVFAEEKSTCGDPGISPPQGQSLMSTDDRNLGRDARNGNVGR
jgi:hypothetical protein